MKANLFRDLLLTSRPVSWINTAYPFAAAYLLAGGSPDWRWAVGAVFFLIPYNLLMYGVNDVFDYESDLRNPRKGGAEGALLQRTTHRKVLWACVVAVVPFVLVLVASGNPRADLTLAVSLFAVLAYSAPKLRFKERPFLDSLTSAVHFVSPGVYGWLLAGGVLEAGPVAAFAAFLLWGMASHALGAIQDIIPDRQGGLASIATVLGARNAARLVALWYLAAGVLVALLPGPGRWAAVLALPYLMNMLPCLNLDDERSGQAHAAWVRFLWLNYVAGFLLTLLLIGAAIIR